LQGKKAEPLIQGWVSFADGRPPCLRSSTFFLDLPPPPVLNLMPASWVPTLEYTVHSWQRPPREEGSPQAASLLPPTRPYLRFRMVGSHVH
jgi:hypothetical protein